MSTALLSLLAFVAWTVLLALGIVVWRSVDALRGVRRLDEFPAGVPHGAEAYWRLNRAHLNCCENLPIFGAAVLVADRVGADPGALCVAYVAARVLQGLVHLASGSPAAVLVRGTFFVVQLLCVLGVVWAALVPTLGLAWRHA